MKINRRCYYPKGCGTRKGECELANPKEDCPNFTPKDPDRETVSEWLKKFTNDNFFYPCRKVKWFFQKLFKGYSSADLWSLDFHLAEVILPRLIAFKASKRHGVPGDLCKINGTEEEFKKEQENWEKIIDSMIEAFDLIVKDEWENIEQLKDRDAKIEKGLKNFSTYFRGLWD